MDKWLIRSGAVAQWLSLGAAVFFGWKMLPTSTPTQNSSMTEWLWPALFIAAILLAGGLHLASALIARGKKDSGLSQPNESTRLIEIRDDLDVAQRTLKTQTATLENCWAAHKKTLKELDECNSHLKHWKGESERIADQYQGQLKLSEDRRCESDERARTLQHDLELAETKLEEFSIPRRRLRIRKAEYSIPSKVGLDVTETLERMILDDRLVLNVMYNDIFRPDPWKGIPKQLAIEFTYGLKEFSVTVPENTKIILPFPHGETTT